ncbi:MAG: SHOCT domain-containing protein [Desulfobacteraceae bacterium]|jgi:putative membrane protein
MDILTQWRGYDWGHGGMMGWGYGTSWLGHIIMLAFWIAVIVGIVFLIRWLIISARGVGQHTTRGDDSALEILKKRYARGEIDKQEFEERKRDLLA